MTAAAEPGRIAWVELNAQRAALATGFYRDLFTWQIHPIHAAPWGTLPAFVNAGHRVGCAFSAMGAFAPPRWLVWIVGDVSRAAERAPDLGARDLGEIGHIPGHGRTIGMRDPLGALVNVIEPEFDLGPPAAPGGVLSAELWAQGALRAAAFYADLLGLEAERTAERSVRIGETAPIWLRDVDYEMAPPRWVPCFRSVSVGGDGRRAEVLGAIPQVPAEDVPGLGRRGVWADPAGAAFALADPGR